MLHLRGNPKDYDGWANITEDPGWSYQGVLPYFKKYEKFGDPNGDCKTLSHIPIPVSVESPGSRKITTFTN